MRSGQDHALEGEAHRPGLSSATAGMPRTIHRDCRHGHGALQNPAHQVGAALFLMSATKKGVSAHQLHRMLGVTYKTAWFMAHRIREAMRAGGLDAAWAAKARSSKPTKPITASARKNTPRPSVASPNQRQGRNKRAIVALVERGGPFARSIPLLPIKLPSPNRARQRRPRETVLHTDESQL